MHHERPNPDDLLDKIKQDELRSARGKLKIFFGSCAGVGKTYAMLSAAHQCVQQGVDVLVGVVETHGRQETQALLTGLELLPLKEIPYRDKLLHEFDIDAALARQPGLILIDELAHSNVEGSRHPKRWQDVEELLSAGIDVYSAVNVQHLETLNDVVGSITGIRVWETVPDHVFNDADEVVLVDLAPDELLQRLGQGKVYLPHQAERAVENFFRKGNLIALRELALRRTADRVDAQMRAYRADRAIANVWHAHERVIACVGPGPGGDQLIRSAARLASELKADWIALYVETPALQRLPKQERQGILDHLQLAQELGAQTATLAGSDAIATLLTYARSRNASKLLVGRQAYLPWHQRWRPRFVDALIQAARDLDVYVVGTQAATFVPAQQAHGHAQASAIKWPGYGWATFTCLVTTLLASQLLRIFDLSNVIMVFLLTVVGVSIRYGRGPGAWAAGLSVLLFDFFFVPPRFSLAVADVQYLFTFALMLIVALTIGQLAAKLRFEALIANLREQRAHALAALSKELSGALLMEQVVEIAKRHVGGTFNVSVTVLLPDSNEHIQFTSALPDESGLQPAVDDAVAQWVYDHQKPAGWGTHTLPTIAARYLPLLAPMRTRGVLALQGANLELLEEPETARLLDTFAVQIALALERIHYVEVAQDALVSMEGERLRHSLLAAISHDLRTPLAVLVGLASTLAERDQPEQVRKELARAICDEAQQMNELSTNLLDMARLQTAGVVLRKDWQSMEEIIGSACAQRQRALQAHQLHVQVPPDLPLCECDSVLIARVFVNLLDNAAKFTPAGTSIFVVAKADAERMIITIDDDGPGLPPGPPERLFDQFSRGKTESNKPGVGLGLALCKTIVQAHGGSISAENRSTGGARFTVTLPLGVAPDEPATHPDH